MRESERWGGREGGGKRERETDRGRAPREEEEKEEKEEEDGEYRATQEREMESRGPTALYMGPTLCTRRPTDRRVIRPYITARQRFLRAPALHSIPRHGCLPVHTPTLYTSREARGWRRPGVGRDEGEIR